MSPDISVLLSETRASASRQRVCSRFGERWPDVRKGQATRNTILAHALHVASCNGLDAITFGSIADQLEMRKSTVFNHFGSREKLLVAVLNLYQAMFRDEVLLPSLAKPRGLPRLVSMYVLWIERFIASPEKNCLFISGATKSGAAEEPVREKLLEMVQAWKAALHRCVQQSIDVGHLREDADPSQTVYEIYGLALRLHHGASLFGTSDSIKRAGLGFERLIRAQTCEGVRDAPDEREAADPPMT